MTTKTRISEIMIVCKTCNTVIMVIHNAIIPFHSRTNNIKCSICNTQLDKPELLDILEIDYSGDDESYKDDYYDKEELK